MQLQQTTPLPNEIIDQHLPNLNQAQMKVLLVIIRQTLGWFDPKTKERKYKDWISIRFFIRKTGLTKKSISLAIQELIDKDLIVVLESYQSKELRTASERRGKKKLYYAYAPYYRAMLHRQRVKKFRKKFTFRP